MTGQPYDEDDAEFQAFLQGKGPLVQGMAELKQPEPSAALDAAILAQVAADLEQATATAANDGQGPADFQPYRWRDRWRMPLALAAGVTAISIALPLWQDEVAQQQQAASMPMQDVQIPPVPLAMPAAGPDADAAPKAAPEAAGAPATKDDAAPPPPAPAKEPARAAAEDDSRHLSEAAAKRKAEIDDVARKTQERERTEAPLQTAQKRAQQPAPAPKAAPMQESLREPLPAPVIAPAPAPRPVPAPVVAPAPAAPPMPGSPPAYGRAAGIATAPAPAAKPDAARNFAEEAVSSPSAMVARIEQLLKDGKRDEALEEWERLRAAWPDYPVPVKLREALGR